jgi:hypothetical protein
MSPRPRIARLVQLGARLDPLAQDGLLYLAASLFAIGQLLFAHGADFVQWGSFAAIPYGVAGLIAIVLHQRQGLATLSARRWLLVGTFVACLALPLGISIAQRAANAPGVHAQDQVVVIERCGDRVLAHQDCYLAHPTTTGIGAVNDSHRLDARAFVPYLPGIALFGIPNGLAIPRPLQDARVWMTAFAVLVVGLALGLSGLGPHQRLRLVQVLIVLPTGALPLVTGGDDVVIMSVLLLATGLAQRRQPVLAGLAAAAAAAIKLTSWPLAFGLALVVRGPDGRPGRGRYLTALLAGLGPLLAVAWAVNPTAFLVNEVLFPLGLTHVHTKARSPFPGEVLSSVLPQDRLMVLGLLAALGLIAGILILRALMPRTVARMVLTVAAGFATAIVLAPATRFGYLIYPIDLLAIGVLVPAIPQVPLQVTQWLRSRLGRVEALPPTERATC